MARNIDGASPSSDGMLRLRPLGFGHWLVQLDTSLGPLTLLVSDRAAGNLYVWLKAALIQRLADDLLTILAERCVSPQRSRYASPCTLPF